MTKSTTLLTQMPLLDVDQQEDAAFRAKDRAWVALARLFDARSQKQGLTYAQLGKRIHRSRAHVQRWLASPFNLSLKSLGLLAEGLDADLVIDIRPRMNSMGSNYCHPSEDAKAAAQNRPSGSFTQTSKATGPIGPLATSRSVEVTFRPSAAKLLIDA